MPRPVAYLLIALLLGRSAFTAAQDLNASPSQQANSNVETIPDGTPVFVRLRQAVRSKTAQDGENVAFEVMEDVTSRDGAVVIEKGATAYGHVTDTQAARRLNRRGRVSVAVEAVEAVTGERIPVRAERKVQGKGSGDELLVAAFSSLPVASWLVLKHGYDIEIPAGASFQVFVTGDSKIDLTKPQTTPTSPLVLYQLAFLHGDDNGMEKQAHAAADKQDVADAMISAQSDTEAYHGRLTKARELTKQAVQSAHRNNATERAALWQALGALHEAELQNRKEAEQQALAALALSQNKDIEVLAALALARSGNSKRVGGLTWKLQAKSPLDPTLNSYWLPSISAATELSHGKPAKAIKLLEPAKASETNSPPPLDLAPFYPAYLRGEAFLALGKASEAAAEFEKITAHPDFVVNFPLGALAQLELGRAYARRNDSVKAGAAYRRFLEIWKRADADLPLRNQALAEGAKYAAN
jgi:hypothetical protein